MTIFTVASAAYGICEVGNDIWVSLDSYGVAKISAGVVTNYPITGMGYARGLCLLGSNLWVTDATNLGAGGGVWKVPLSNPSSAVKYSIGAAGYAAADICVANDGNLYMCNAGAGSPNVSAWRVTPGGTIIPMPSFMGWAGGMEQIVLGPDNRLWMADTAGAIRAFSTSFGSLLVAAVGSGAIPWAICVGPEAVPNQQLWFTDANNGELWKCSTSGTITRITPSPVFSTPNSILTAYGSAWVGDTNLQNLYEYDVSGTLINTIPVHNFGDLQALCTGPLVGSSGVVYSGPLVVAPAVPAIWSAGNGNTVQQIAA